MPRYVNVFAVNKSVEDAVSIVYHFLASEAFDLKYDKNGESFWQKGNGWVAGPQFVCILVKPGWVRIQAWIKYAFLPGVFRGEMDFSGCIGLVAKERLRQRVSLLEKMLAG